jgi:hypothetical protein
MSFGFARRPKKARRLKNLQISEVSSVDVGAGYGVNVVLAKRDTGHVERKETPMRTSPGANEFSIAKSLHDTAQRGELSEYDLSIAIGCRA